MSLSGIKRLFLRIEATITISLSEYNKLKEENLLLKKQVSELTGQVSGMMKIIEALQEEIRLLGNGKNYQKCKG